MGDSTAIVRVAPLTLPPPSWHRWPSEPEDAYEAFEKYRDQKPPRRMARIIGYPTAAVADWSRTFDWVGRARDLDSHLASIYDIELAEAIKSHARDVAGHHAQLLAAARDLVMRQIDKYLDIDKDGVAPVLKPHEVSRLLDLVVKYDRLTAGKSTENVAVNHTDMSRLDADDLKAMIALRKKMQGG